MLRVVVEDTLPRAMVVLAGHRAARAWPLKPANIKVRPDGTVKVLDFGLAKGARTDFFVRRGRNIAHHYISRDDRRRIKVLMAKNYIDNLGEEVRKGMIEKARPGHWPTVAPVGYQNNLMTHRIEPDSERAPIIVKLFEWYASGEHSLKVLTQKASRSWPHEPDSR